jgi:hypothetical protein
MMIPVMGKLLTGGLDHQITDLTVNVLTDLLLRYRQTIFYIELIFIFFFA